MGHALRSLKKLSSLERSAAVVGSTELSIFACVPLGLSRGAGVFFHTPLTVDGDQIELPMGRQFLEKTRPALPSFDEGKRGRTQSMDPRDRCGKTVSRRRNRGLVASTSLVTMLVYSVWMSLHGGAFKAQILLSRSIARDVGEPFELKRFLCPASNQSWRRLRASDPRRVSVGPGDARPCP